MTQNVVRPRVSPEQSVGRTAVTALSVELVGAFALLVTAGVHIADVSGKLEESTYIGVGFILGPIAGALLGAVLLVGGNQTMGWVVGAGISAATAIGYVLSRTSGLPRAREDIGNWGEPIGVLSLIAEGVVLLCVALAATRSRGRTRGPSSARAA